MPRRRSINLFSLSFLDVMSCGFGAVVLIFLIINHATEEHTQEVNKDRLAEVRMLDYQVQMGEKDLFELLERMEAVRQRLDDSDARLISTRTAIDRRREDISKLEQDSLAQRASLEQLRADVEGREEELERLRALEEAQAGGQIVSFQGDGDRQYLTGLKVGGKNVLIALDMSASMLDQTIVNVIRRRNMDDERKRQAPKWQRAVRTVEWLSAQLPLDAEFQIYGFNTETRSLVPENGNGWIPLGDGRELEAALTTIKDMHPHDGSNLLNLMTAIREMDPLPDNVYLITDSLPTQGSRAPRGPTVTGRERLALYREAVQGLPNSIPFNVILFPMEGDPMAAASYWQLAFASGGSFLSPSGDWP
ncbi:MAG: hypothetical protein ACNA7W_14195 [Pseudomonadales bacterium]